MVGTIIIAAVAIIFLPDLLDGDKKTYQEEFERIPSAPEIDFTPKNKSFPEDKLSQLPKEKVTDDVARDEVNNEDVNPQSGQVKTTPLVSNTAQVKASAVKNEQNFQDQVNESIQTNKLPERAITKQAWAIQLGSFRHKNNVDELVSKLKSHGYTVFTKPIKTKNGNLTKVFVGPELIKSSLEKKLPALKQLTNVAGKVARFSPTNG